MAGSRRGKETETFWQRLRKASDYANVPCTPSDIAKELGVVNSAVTKYIDGGFPTKTNLNKLAHRRRVRSEWLLSGQGPMISERDLDEDTQELLRLWRSIDAEGKQRVLANVRYEHIAAESLSTGKHQALTDALIQQRLNPRNRQ